MSRPPVPSTLTNEELVRVVANARDSTVYERELALRLDNATQAAQRLVRQLQENDLFDPAVLQERSH